MTSTPDEEYILGGDVLWLCNKCPALFRDDLELINHVTLSHEFFCSICEEAQFCSKEDFIDHIVSDHTDSSKKTTLDIGIQCSFDVKIKQFDEDSDLDTPLSLQEEDNALGCIKSEVSGFLLAPENIASVYSPAPEIEEEENFKIGNAIVTFESSTGVKISGSRYNWKKKTPWFANAQKSYTRYDCTTCHEKFIKRREYLQHMEESHGGNFSCDVCGLNYKSDASLRFHVARKHPNKHKCPLCPFKTHLSVTFKRHLASIHPGKSFEKAVKQCAQEQPSFKFATVSQPHMEKPKQKDFPCVTCGLVYATDPSLRCHRLRKHRNAFKCDMCDFSTHLPLTLEKHRKSHGLGPLEVAEPIVVSPIDKKEKTEGGCFVCADCGLSYGNDLSYRSHLQRKHPDKFKCGHCSFKTHLEFRFKKHLFEHKDLVLGTEGETCLDVPITPKISAGISMVVDDDLSVSTELPPISFKIGNLQFSCEGELINGVDHFRCPMCAKTKTAKNCLYGHVRQHVLKGDATGRDIKGLTVDPEYQPIDANSEMNESMTDGNKSVTSSTSRRAGLSRLKRLSTGDGSSPKRAYNRFNCCVGNCRIDLTDAILNVEYTLISEDDEFKPGWVEAIQSKLTSYTPAKCHKVCFRHFNTEDFESDPDTDRVVGLKEGAVPSVFVVSDTSRMYSRVIQNKYKLKRRRTTTWKRLVTDEEKEGKTKVEIVLLERSCPICGQDFRQFPQYNHHMRLVHNENRFPVISPPKQNVMCEICAETVSELKYPKHMIEKHSGAGAPEKYECPLCGKSYSSKKAHCRGGKPNCVQEIRICPFCPKELTTTAGLEYHIANSHEIDNKRYQSVNCHICGNTLNNTKCLYRHIKEVHEKNKLRKSCSICGKVLSGNLVLEDHINAIHTKQWSYQCVDCGKNFSRKKGVWRHYKIDHQILVNTFNCEQYMKTIPFVGTNRKTVKSPK